MFRPRRKLWSAWSLKAPAEKNVSKDEESSDHNFSGEFMIARGKDDVLQESTRTHSKGENGETMDLSEKLSMLENELFEYQYNLGLLLIEKKNWSSKIEELHQAFAETKDALKREQAAHFIAISEVEKREENLRKALGVERQCVLELEKALHEIRSEYAGIKFMADSKLAEANALITSIEEKSLEIELRLHAADAQNTEVSRRSSEIERKSHEVEVRENTLRRERLSFNAEHEAHMDNVFKHREDLRGWERKLQEGEERLDEVRRLLNQREEKANENDRIYHQKMIDLEGTQKRIKMANSSLKKKEDDVRNRIQKLASSEKDADTSRKSLEMKEKELLELEERLNSREQVEIQKLHDEHDTILEARKHDFELEIEQKRKAFDDDFKSRVAEVEKKELQVNHMEAKVAKREQGLEKELEKSKEKDKNLESKLNDLNEWEKSVRFEEEKMENERRHLLLDKEGLLSLKVEIENTRLDIEEQQRRINEECELLKLTEEEKSEHGCLRSELKQEIDKCKLQRERLLKEREDLKQEKERFEKEWEDLDEKRLEIEKELEHVTVQKDDLEKFKRFEEERLNNEKLKMQSYVERELEALKVAKESFATSIDHEKLVMAEKTQSEKNQMLNEFEVWKREVATNLIREKEDMENDLHKRKELFNEERERELNNINYLKEEIGREVEEMKLERSRIEKEKQEISINQKHLDDRQLEMRKAIDELVKLSKKLQEQREQFLKEREHFISFLQNHKSCKNCEELTSEFVISDLQSIAALDDMKSLPFPQLAEDYLREAHQGTPDTPISEETPRAVNLGSPVSGGTMSWLRKCTSKIFDFSAGKKNEFTGTSQNLPIDHVDMESSPQGLMSTGDEPQLQFQVAADSLDVQIVESNDSIREMGFSLDPSASEHSDINRKMADIIVDSQHSRPRVNSSKSGKRGRRKVNKRNNSKAVISGGKPLLGDADLELNDNGHSNGTASVYANDIRGASSHSVKGTIRKGKTRKPSRRSKRRADTDSDYSEGHSENVINGGRRKRRQKVVTAVQPTDRTWYNLQRPKIAAPVAANEPISDLNKVEDKETDNGDGMREEIAGKDDRSMQVVQVSVLKSIKDVNESLPGDHGTEAAGESQRGYADAAKQADDDTVLSEEVDGVAKRTDGHENQEHRSGGSNGESEDDSNDEARHLGEVSITKKLWTFLTT